VKEETETVGDPMQLENCFVASTAVLTDHGPRRIEDVRAGDRVWSRDSAGGGEGLKAVRRTFVSRAPELVHLRYRSRAPRPPSDAERGEGTSPDGEGGGGEERDDDPDEIVGTPGHPFWSESRGTWVFLGDLEPGEVLRLTGGGLAEVVDVRLETAPGNSTFTTYNMEVEDWHTYFVGGGGAAPGVWVHNASPLRRRLQPRHHEKAGVEGMISDVFGAKVRGFRNAEEVRERLGNLRNRIRKIKNLGDAEVGIRGSALTGESSKGGGFRWVRESENAGLNPSDVDFFFTSATLERKLCRYMVDGRLKPGILMEHAPELAGVLHAFDEQTRLQLGRGQEKKSDPSTVLLHRDLVQGLAPQTFLLYRR
jgi:hypothetical protein